MFEFTVFITSYNYGHYISKAIDSVINQTHPEWNLYILDNGSTDNTFEVIQPYLSDSRIKLIKRPTNIGHTMNITRGFLELDGKYISTLQADDWLEKNFIKKALSAFTKHPKIPLAAFGWMAYIEPNGDFLYADTIPFPREFEGIAQLSPHLTLGNFIPLHLIAFEKREIEFIFREMIETPLRQLGEQFIIKRLEDRNGPSYFSAEVGGYWRRHATQLTNLHAKNYLTSIENVVEPLIYNQVKDCYNVYSRFLSLVYFISTSSNIPYRSAIDWLVSENGRHLAEQNGISITSESIVVYQSLACALMMAHNTLANSQLISTDEIHRWAADLLKQFGIEKRQIIEIANYAYDGHLFSNEIENIIARFFDQPDFQTRITLDGFSPNTQYSKWLGRRGFIPEDLKTIENSLTHLKDPVLSFHLFIRLQAGNETLLADTLDSLNQQFHSNWHLDIITSLPAPDGLDDLPCVGWNKLNEIDKSKEAIDFLVDTRELNWLIELPAGARLDPLYLWRLTEQAKNFPEALAFFVDDDCCDESGQRHSPRFKPGVNPAGLLSADLAGPICLRRDTWLNTGGASQRNGSPWFSQLLRVADKFGWDLIKHVPDILISYPVKLPTDTESCLFALLASLQSKEINGEIIPATGQSWCIRYPLNSTPTVSIAILSQGQLDLASRCFDSIMEKTNYPDFEIIIVLTDTQNDSDLNAWLNEIQRKQPLKFRLIRTDATGNHATRCNAAMKATDNEFLLLIREEAVIIQDRWLEELVRTCLQPDIAAASPCLISPGTSQICEAGSVLGLQGIVGSPYQGKAKLGEPGYLDCLRVARDTSALSGACMLIRTTAYLAAGGMDETNLGNHLSDTDLCQKIRSTKQRLIYQPQSTVVYGGPSSTQIMCNNEHKAQSTLAEAQAKRTFSERWLTLAAVDPFWNQNLSLDSLTPTPEADYRAQWQYLPSPAPRVLARALPNGQGVFRITSPLRALRKAGLAAECVWSQEGPREPSASELLLLAPDTTVVQHYINEPQLAVLEAWQALPTRPFTVFALDDLLTNMSENNPFRRHIPANSRARLKYALERCDRMVVSTNYLANAYYDFIPDIRVVPNRLEQELWLPLETRKRTGTKSRIGWAGGTTHQGDLLLLKEVIEQTRHEADWIFFGMCPDEIRPLIAEYHALGSFAEYPARLAALNLDMAVAPLEQIPFNRGKSNLRLLEYGILGIPVVCTDIDPYQDGPACRVANTAASWIKALRERIHDADGREREGQAMRNWVHAGFLLENHLEDWLKAHLPD